MIPIQLTLRNFLSYRDMAELELSGLHLASITGLNGAGKSTILDGITWALFGKSRVKSDDDIVNRAVIEHGGAAEVQFIFELEGAVYRIIRRKTAGKSVELELQTRAGEDGQDRWQVKTEARVRDTQLEIERLLRMNYDVFTNASFLLQGKADEFTTKTPDKRKEILAEILGVSQWDAFKDIATERRKAVENDVASLERRLNEVEAELSEEEGLVRALELLEAKAEALTAARDRQEALVMVARQNKTMADQQRESLRRMDSELAEADRETRQVEQTTEQRRRELDDYRSVLSRRDAIMAAFQQWQAADNEVAVLQDRAEQHNTIARLMHPLEMEIARMESQLEQRLIELEAQGVRAHAAVGEIKTLKTGLAERNVQLSHLRQRVAELADQTKEFQETQMKLQGLEYEHNSLAKERLLLEARLKEVDQWEQERSQYIASRQEIDALLAEAVQALDDLAQKSQIFANKSIEKKTIEAEQARLRSEMDDVKERMTRIGAELGQECPLCGQSLTEEHRHRVLLSLQAEGDARGDQFRRNKAALSELDRDIPQLEKALQQQALWEKKRQTQQAALVRVDTRLQDIQNSLDAWHEGSEAEKLTELILRIEDVSEREELAARLELTKQAAEEARILTQELQRLEISLASDQTTLNGLEKSGHEWENSGRPERDKVKALLADKSFAGEERAKLAELHTRLAAVGYNESTLVAARALRNSLAAAPQEQQRLIQAEAAEKPLAGALADLEGQRGRLAVRIAEIGEQREKAVGLLAELEAGIGDLPSAELELQVLRDQVIAETRAVGAARQKVAVLKIRREDRLNLTNEKNTLLRRSGLLRQLEEACGRKGVQAMLIEAALPEIEGYANDLLDRLTGGEMRVAIDTQKAAKSKQDSTIDTLDIKISDGSGGKPYENYSGGEKFRINFAVRLALSQVLAHRAGARLQTLVIDEGFGSQDPEGRQRLVEAINAIQDKFACILVITHIDELRDKFPVRIEVEKTAVGSRLSVVTI